LRTALDHSCGELDLLVFRQAGRLAHPLDQRSLFGLRYGQLLDILLGLFRIGDRRLPVNFLRHRQQVVDIHGHGRAFLIDHWPALASNARAGPNLSL
jgi:hypothetical protein